MSDAFVEKVLRRNVFYNSCFPAESTVTVKGLLDWKRAYKLQEMFTTEEFSTFLPPPESYKGEVWYLVNPAEGEEYTGNLSNNRYIEAGPFSGSEIVIRKLLSMFHPNVFIQTRFTPRGCLAILQAETNKLMSVLLRCHVEFQLNEPPLKPFWFTPAKFEGQIILFKDSGKPVYMTLEVPNTNHVNVDMEWVSSENSMHVDIGYMPLMKLQLLEDWDPSTEHWTNISSMETAFKILEQKMLPFKQELSLQNNEIGAAASTLLSRYEFPVTSEILSPSGKVVQTLNTNDIMETNVPGDTWNRYQDPAQLVYLGFLKDAVSNIRSSSEKK